MCWPIMGDKSRQKQFNNVIFHRMEGLRSIPAQLRNRTVLTSTLFSDRHYQLLSYLSALVVKDKLERDLGPVVSRDTVGFQHDKALELTRGQDSVKVLSLLAQTLEVLSLVVFTVCCPCLKFRYGLRTPCLVSSLLFCFIFVFVFFSQARVLDVKDDALAQAHASAQLQDEWQAHADELTDIYRAQFARRHALWQALGPLQASAASAQHHWASVMAAHAESQETALKNALAVTAGDLYRDPSVVAPTTDGAVAPSNSSDTQAELSDAEGGSDDGDELEADNRLASSLAAATTGVRRDPQLGAWLGHPLRVIRQTRRAVHDFVAHARVQRGIFTMIVFFSCCR